MVTLAQHLVCHVNQHFISSLTHPTQRSNPTQSNPPVGHNDATSVFDVLFYLLSFAWSWHYSEMWQFPPSNRKANSSAAQSRGFTFVRPPASPLTFVRPQRLILEPKNVSQNLLQYWSSPLALFTWFSIEVIVDYAAALFSLFDSKDVLACAVHWQAFEGHLPFRRRGLVQCKAKKRKGKADRLRGCLPTLNVTRLNWVSSWLQTSICSHF